MHSLGAQSWCMRLSPFFLAQLTKDSPGQRWHLFSVNFSFVHTFFFFFKPDRTKKLHAT